jgi:hypothetical protein
MKTAELTGHALNWAVAQAEGDKVYHPRLGRPDNWDKEAYLKDGSDDRWVVRVQNPTLAYFVDWTYNPSGSWWEGGPIIEREKLGVWFSDEVIDEDGNILREVCWYCETSCTADNGDEPYQCDTGPTPLIAAMRCYVASKLGDEVDVPNELTKGE